MMFTYGVGNLYDHWTTVYYRESYNMHANCGILLNHESPQRGPEFVTRKISLGLARIKLGKQQVLELGNLDAKRDRGFAGDYVEGMWRMLQQPHGNDFVLATGTMVTVRSFVDSASACAGMTIEWGGAVGNSTGRRTDTGTVVVRVNPEFYRSAEVDLLIGEPAKAKSRLGWTSTKTLAQLTAMMIEADLDRVQADRVRG